MKIISKFFAVFVLLLSLAGYSQVANGGEPYLNKLLVNKSSANERAVFENFYRGHNLATYQIFLINIFGCNHSFYKIIENCIFRLRAVYSKTKLG